MYDYVIVGAGSAGCVLAARLSEDPDVKVLLLESGGPDTNENIHVPAGYLSLGRTEIDWDLETAPEPECYGRRIKCPRGRVLGGSSSINAMVYIRGARADYDGWGIDGWSYADLLPYFMKSEDNERGANEFHGAGGPLGVSNGRSLNPMVQGFIDGATEAGFAANDDFNGAAQEGFGFYQLTQRGGMRCSTAVAFLHPAMERPNLTVAPFMHTHKIMFDGTRAVGVVASQLGQLQEFRAEREVILAAGAYGSPQLLMLSGVGEAEHLTMKQIEVVLDQPEVGNNLTDHAATQAVFNTPEEVSLLLALEPAALEEFEATQTGVLTSNLAEGGGFVRLEGGASAPDVQYHVAPVQILDEGMADPTAHGMWMSPCLLQPESRGTVRLQNNDPTGKPIIRNNVYSTERDMRVAVDGLRLMMEIARQPAMKPYAVNADLVPASDSEEDLRDHVRRTTYLVYHPVGTCSMGTVVDNELRVNGLEGLRVVDASVMPMVPRGNTNAPTIAIAERAADLIRGEVLLAPSAPEAAAATA